jgi:pyrroloquinoline quinone biosynthesis protein E
MGLVFRAPATTVPIGTITLEITHRCHRRCAFCYVSGLSDAESRSDRELSPAELTRAVGGLVAATGCRNLQISGGEPLLRRDLLEIIDALREAGSRISIITDGAQLSSDLAHSLADRGVAMLQPTLLAGSARIHDSLRGRGAFRDATRAIATAAAAGIAVSVCMVITRRNFAEAGRVAELAFALGARGVALSRFCSAGAARTAAAALMPDAGQVRAAVEAAAAMARDLGIPLAAAVTIPRCVFEDPDHPPLRVGVCSLVGPKSTLTIGPDGQVRSCSLSTQSVGNVIDDSWEVLARRLWDRELGPLRESPPEACRGCRHLPKCLGGCRLSADPLAPGG